MRSGWQFWIDRGGTFTDVIGVSPTGQLHVRKVLSQGAAGDPSACDRGGGDPEAGTTAAGDPGIRGASDILSSYQTSASTEGGSTTAIKPSVRAVKVGTTVATNALLERTGVPVLLVTTQGLADGLRIGYQNRPDIFARHIQLPDRLFSSVIEAYERIDAAGEVLSSLDTERLRQELQRARNAGFRAVAIVLMHGWKFTQHEQEAASIAREIGFEEVSVSHELSPLVRYVARGDTTVLNAYLALPLRGYISGLQRELHNLDPDARLEMMQSHGGLAAADAFHAMSSVLSGPAGGLIGMQWIGNRLSLPRLVGFDMGGTSTDVSLLDGELPRRFEHIIAGVRLQSPMLDVHTIAAGGGSILHFADGRFAAGPDSAGAVPGPACYGRGGPLTLTDVQVLLGHLRPDTLPAVFGRDGQQVIDPAIVSEKFTALVAELEPGVTGDPAPSMESVAESFLQVAVESMANAIRQVSTRQGLDAAEFTLFCFGGAAGQHACRVAQAAGMKRVLVHPLASVLSAFGIGVADRLAMRRSSVRLPLREIDATRGKLHELEAHTREELAAFSGGNIGIEHWLELRAGDSETSLSVLTASYDKVLADFSALHLKRFGFAASPDSVVIDAVRVEARMASIDPRSLQMPQTGAGRPLPATARAWFDGWQDVPLVKSASITSDVKGPALIVEPNSTIVLENGWIARRLPEGELLLEAPQPAALTATTPDAAQPTTLAPNADTPDPARIEIFNNLFMHIAEQMGEVLKATAQSVNIKERLDYSCALFDALGGLVANAPHMPVHLGSMGASVRAVIDRTFLCPGDSWLVNSPYHGGTHLPDMTVVTPVFLAGSPIPDFFVASRAHHADIGGSTPGSMPPFSKTIEEEGVLFECFPLVVANALRERELRDALKSARYPARNPDQNVADLQAQLAANARGIAEIERAVERHTLPVVRSYMRHVQDNAATSVRNAIGHLQPGEFRYEMDSGQVIAVRIDINHAARSARIDFTGTSGQDPHNFNAPRAVCLAAVLYVFRTLIDRPIPLNEGCLEPLEVIIPPGSMLDPLHPAAVAAGNVETSQCIVDALYGALGVLAASQGTMNNLTFGDSRLQYYETIAGGSGAGPDFDGSDAVQTHMTNSRLTDPEILESKFPVLLREFSIRRGSGGRGMHRGGDGVIRRLEFRAPMSGALLANHRRIAPFGVSGGESAQPGAGSILRKTGSLETLGATAGFDLEPGDLLSVETPGGGAFGAASRTTTPSK